MEAEKCKRVTERGKRDKRDTVKEKKMQGNEGTLFYFLFLSVGERRKGKRWDNVADNSIPLSLTSHVFITE